MEKTPHRASIILGTLLLAAGILTLVGQIISPAGRFLWPVIIVGIGLAFFVGMLITGRSFGALAIPGSIITGIGLLLLLQNFFGLWETWSYTWALVISLAGVGLVIYGYWSNLPELKRSGWRIARTGLTLFIIFGLIFEFIFAASGISARIGGLFWPLVLVFLGLGMIFSRSYRLIRNREEDRQSDLNLFWPVLFIGAGILWYLVQQGALATTDLSVLISLWPVLLVAAGVNLLLGQRLQWINLLLGVVVVAGMFYVIYNDDRLGLTAQMPWSILGVNISDNQPVTEWIAGSGVMAEETRTVEDFNRIALNSTGELIITQASRPALVIEAEDNLLPYLVTEVSGGQLVIKTKPAVGFSTTRPIRYHLTVVDLKSVNISGAGSLHADSFEGQDLHISLSGVGDVFLDNIQVDSFDINISGSGNVKVKGSTHDLDVKISGAGGFSGPEFASEEAKIEISGVGRAIVWATTRLETRISGLGGVNYYGSPQVIQKTAGIGNVQKLGDK
ncbi:MAG: DUF2807 domain-containing protein [Anaerolineales bacterium]|nr:DUF2807 domain-containing protein [Anaerolineales bacterium]